MRLLGLAVGLLALNVSARPAPWATGESKAEDLVAYLVTFGPGPDLASWWGHTALVIEDRRLHHARLYNYGMFTFDRAMLAKFAMGRLEFWVGEAPFRSTLEFYADAKRRVSIQELNLLPAARMDLAHRLAENVKLENRTYLYDHYGDNCSSRPRDMLDAVIGRQLTSATAGPGQYTLREQTRRYTQVNVFWALLLDFAMNDLIDRPIRKSAEAFLPEELERQVAALQFRDASGASVPLVRATTVFSEGRIPRVPETPPSYLTACWALGSGAGLLLLFLLVWARAGEVWPTRLAGAYQMLLGVCMGIAGVVLMAFWLFTEHTITWRNENLFLVNPIYLALIPLGFRFAKRDDRRRQQPARLWLLLAGVGVLGIALKVLPQFDQRNAELVALLLPVSVFGAMGAAIFARRKAA
ncbi:MAG: DUF4105 domain-containing protein [Myxococcaceae bacterium]